MKNFLAMAAVLLLISSGAAFAQSQGGNLYGATADDQGAALPGVTVTLSGQGAAQVQITDAQGNFRFLGLSPGAYALNAVLDGFSTIDYPNIVINVGRNTTIEIEMNPAIEETITVTSESPLLDERAITFGATVSQKELEKIPTSRDPWTILQTVPHVRTDRINVGGNESGQQSNYVGPGATDENSVWAVDGVIITDMTAIGSSPTYYDFDAFEEMQVATGGSDIQLATGGVTMNMVTKRGTNEWRGSGRYFLTDDAWQADLDFSEGDLGQSGDWNNDDDPQESFKQGNRIVEIKDYGLEVGGPVVKDRLWFWGSYGMQKPHLLTILDLSDRTELETFSGKINAQLTNANSAVAFYLRGNKMKTGRNAGPTRLQPASWNQTGPTDIYKLEDTHVFGSSFYVTGMVSHVGGGFQLTPQGGYPDGLATVLDADFRWDNNFLHYETVRPQDQMKIDGSYFFNTGNINNELKYGVGYRTADVDSLTAWPAASLNLNFYQAFGYEFNQVAFIRDSVASADISYTSLYLQDTMTFSNLTLNVGLRYDKQDGTMLSATAVAVPGFDEPIPEMGYDNPLPTATFNGGDDGFEWTSITPRIGLTWALGEERKTLVRAGFSQFADQLAHWNGPLHIWPLVAAYSYFYYDDLNGNGTGEPNEVVEFLFDYAHDPLGQFSVNRIDPNYDPGMTDELVLGVEHSVLPELVLGFNVTWRNLHDLADRERLVQDCVDGVCGPERVHQRSDYVLGGTLEGTLPDGSTYNVPYYGLRDGVVETQGFLLESGDREQDYLGFALTVTKRLSNRWMLRGNFSWSTWEWNIPENEQEDPNDLLGSGSVDGSDVLFGSGTGSGSKGGVYINSNWSYSLTGMYQIAPDQPWGFNVSASLNGREGYPIPYYRRASLDGVTGIQVGGATAINLIDPADYRNDDIMLLDMRVEKEFNLKNFSFTGSIDGFNLFNDSTVLQRQHRLRIGSSDQVQEIVSARVFRIGVRFSFN